MKPLTIDGDMHCANCGTAMRGEFCHVCGQSVHSVLKPMHHMVEETVETVLHIDGRIVHTLPPLLLKPGFLTLEYFRGRRVRYIGPFRLMFVLCLLAFFVCHLRVENSHIELGPHTRINTTDNAFDAATTPAATAGATDDHTQDIHTKISDDWLTRTSRIEIAWLPGFINNGLSSSVDHLKTNIHAMKSPGASRQEAYDRMLANFFGALPQTMFVMIPLFALLLRLFYVLRRRLYMEHLIVALHSHAYLFLSLLLGIALAALSGWLAPRAAWTVHPLTWLEWLLALWVPVYLLIMQKRIYRQGWQMTVLKFCCIGCCYLGLLSAALVIAAVLGLAS